jgi:predicted DCC family thiol-disulfide oxidoreductase YuxK
MKETAAAPDGLMLFDGLCNFCSTSVNLALALDCSARLRFCPIQSPCGRALAARHGLDPANPDSFVFFDCGEAKFRSAGALALAGRLPAPWRWARGLAVLPAPLRDGAYDWIAARRYRLFGRRSVCRLPTEAERSRFVVELDEA